MPDYLSGPCLFLQKFARRCPANLLLIEIAPDQLLEQVEAKLETVPKAGVYLAEVPRMIALLKDYIQKDYTDTPKKSLILIVAALLYLINPKDIIPDKFLGVGLIDDAAVIAACIALTKGDLDTYKAWKDSEAQA